MVLISSDFYLVQVKIYAKEIISFYVVIISCIVPSVCKCILNRTDNALFVGLTAYYNLLKVYDVTRNLYPYTHANEHKGHLVVSDYLR